MIELKRDQMEKAIEKAKQHRCHVRATAWRRYEVRTPEGKLYQVTFDVDQAGRKLAGCNCKAGENERVCYHAAAAVQAHCLIAAMRQQVEPLCEAIAAPAAKPAAEDHRAEAARILASRAAGGPAFGIVALVNRMRAAQSEAKAEPEAPAPTASADEAELINDLIDDDPDFWEAQGVNRPRKMSGREVVLAGRANSSGITWHQMVALKAKPEAAEMCREIYHCELDELNRRTASALIGKLRARAEALARGRKLAAREMVEHLNGIGEAVARVAEKSESVLIKQQPPSIGRIGGYEL